MLLTLRGGVWNFEHYSFKYFTKNARHKDGPIIVRVCLAATLVQA